MDDRVPRLRIGPYLFVRSIEPGRSADRWLAVHERDDTTFVVHRFRVPRDRVEQRRFVGAVEALSELNHPHVLPIVQSSLGSAWAGNAWVVTPYTGNADGLVTLERLARDKGGRVPPNEVERAAVQLLEAVEHCHALGHAHGSIQADEVLVDPRGSLSIELYGLGRLISGGTPSAAGREVRVDEVRSIISLAYRLLTGLTADEPRIPAARLVPKLARGFEEWLERGLDPVHGYSTAAEALAALGGVELAGDAPGISPVRVVIGRVRQALGSI
ncbi:MAG: protein kinase domain-containing protein [Phycisphaerales bacterium]